MDRVAQLAAQADFYLGFDALLVEHGLVSAEQARSATRGCLANVARELGFPELEISAAIDTALAGR